MIEALEQGIDVFDKHVSNNLKNKLEEAIGGNEDENKLGLSQEAALYGVQTDDENFTAFEISEAVWESFEKKIAEVTEVSQNIISDLVSLKLSDADVLSVISVLRRLYEESLEPIDNNTLTIKTKDKNNLEQSEKIKTKALNLAHYFELRLLATLEEKKQEVIGQPFFESDELKKLYFALKHSEAAKKDGVFKQDIDERAIRYSGIEAASASNNELVLTADEVSGLKKIANIFGENYESLSQLSWLTETFFKNTSRQQSVEDKKSFHPIVLERLENLQTLLSTLQETGDINSLSELDIVLDATRISEILDFINQLLDTHKQIEQNDVSQTEEFTSWQETVLRLLKVDNSISVEAILSRATELLQNGTLTQHKDTILPQLSSAMGEILSQRRIILEGKSLYSKDGGAIMATALAKQKQDFLNKTVDKIKKVIETFDPAEANLYRGGIATAGELEAPPQKTESAWMGAYKAALEGRTEDAITSFLDQEMYELEEIEHGYAERERFKHHEKGVRFLGLIEWIEQGIKKIPSLHKYHSYFENRLAFAEMMGPYAASNKITADFRKSVEENYPEYAVWNHQYFLGTKEGGDKYEHYQAVRFAEKQIETYLHEQYDFMTDSGSYKQGNQFVEGFFSLGRGSWMSGEGGFHEKLVERLKVELKEKYVHLSDDELKIVARISFSAFALTGGKGDMFMPYYRIGMSPPQLAELGFMVESHPEAKDFNLACKKVTEIPSVVHGMYVDRRWLLKMATKNGLYAFFEKNGDYQKDGYVAGRLWGRGDAPDVYDHTKFNDYINSLDEDECDEVLDLIRSGSASSNNAYTRFRNLLRSIEVSEAKAAVLNMHNQDRKMQLVDLDGTPNDKGDFVAPLVMTPRMMMFGATEFLAPESDVPGYFAELQTNFHDVHVNVHDALVKFRSKIYSAPPKIESGIDHQTEAIHAIAQDFFECLALTSAMKAQMDMVNWPKVQAMFDYRLHILFATYIEAGFNVDDKPVKGVGQLTSDLFGFTITIEDESLIEALRHVVETSGQTMGGKGETTWMHIANERNGYGSIPKKYDVMNQDLAFKDSLLALFVTRADIAKGKKGRGDMAAMSGGMYLGGIDERRKLLNKNWNTYMELRDRYKVSDGDILTNNLLPRDSAEKQSQEKDLKEAESEGKKH